jgi:tetratricopeptide (TPR) repeat protein
VCGWLTRLAIGGHWWRFERHAIFVAGAISVWPAASIGQNAANNVPDTAITAGHFFILEFEHSVKSIQIEKLDVVRASAETDRKVWLVTANKPGQSRVSISFKDNAKVYDTNVLVTRPAGEISPGTEKQDEALRTSSQQCRDPRSVGDSSVWAIKLVLSINGCSAVIESGRWSGKDLAWIFIGRGSAYSSEGDYDSAVADYDQAIQLNPNDTAGYINRGNAYVGKGDRDRAIADYNKAIELDSKFGGAYYNRGLVYADKGDFDRAIADYDQAIRIGIIDAQGQARCARGNDVERLCGAEIFFARGKAYSAKGEFDRAIADYDEAIRLDQKNSLIYKEQRNDAFTAKITASAARLNSDPSTASISVPLQADGGTYVVPILINNAITLNFTVDSGARDVSIPADVVLTLIRTGTLDKSDFIGSATYLLADGSTMPSTRFRIRSLKIGDRLVQDVSGSISPVGGTLLLGQSFLSHFKSWSINNARQTLVLVEY